MILYQGALNVGRGLELMIETMQYVDNAIFILVGSGDITKKLQSLVKQKKLEQKVRFLGRITPNELRKITPKADLGISLEEDLGLSYHFALPNKIFDYIHAEIPVLASDLPEMKKIITHYQVGEIATNRNPENLAKQIVNLLHKPKTEFLKALKKAKKDLNWQRESKKLLNMFKTN
jgi:glycosyltransferase involved in cell wall biosynthesis